MQANSLELLDVPNRKAWRAWLQKNHARDRGIWLVAWKVASGKKTLSYDDAVEEALCFGWIDSTIRSLDEQRFARKFTPRKDAANWSEPNLKRFSKVQAAGMVTEAGLRVFAPIARTKVVAPAKTNVAVPDELANALDKNPKAKQFFAELAQSYRNQFIGWIGAAKRPETRTRRITEAIMLLSKGQKLGMK